MFKKLLRTYTLIGILFHGPDSALTACHADQVITELLTLHRALGPCYGTHRTEKNYRPGGTATYSHEIGYSTYHVPGVGQRGMTHYATTKEHIPDRWEDKIVGTKCQNEGCNHTGDENGYYTQSIKWEITNGGDSGYDLWIQGPNNGMNGGCLGSLHNDPHLVTLHRKYGLGHRGNFEKLVEVWNEAIEADKTGASHEPTRAEPQGLRLDLDQPADRGVPEAQRMYYKAKGKAKPYNDGWCAIC